MSYTSLVRGRAALLLGLAALVGAACGRTARQEAGASSQPDAGEPALSGAGAVAGDVASGAAANRGGAGGSPVAEPVGGAGDGSGMAGEGAALLPAGCDVVVAGVGGALDVVLKRITPPAVVCLEPGQFESSTSFNLALRDAVVVRGLGGGESVLCGNINATAAVNQGVVLEDLVISGRVLAQAPVKLTLRRVVANQPRPGCPAEPEQPAIDLAFSDPGESLLLLLEDVRFAGPGVVIQPYTSAVASRVQVDIRRSSCMAHQCWDFARITLGSLPPGSWFDVRIENNIIQNSVLDAIAVQAELQDADDAANSWLRIINNTIHSQGDFNFGIHVSDGLVAQGVVANNAVENIANPLMIGDFPAVGNVLSVGDADHWFADIAAGDFTPAPDSMLRGAAVAEELPGDDFTGQPRSALDVGALEYR